MKIFDWDDGGYSFNFKKLLNIMIAKGICIDILDDRDFNGLSQIEILSGIISAICDEIYEVIE